LVSESGGRSWILRITIRGRRSDLGLGSFEFVTLADAREKAFAIRRSVRVDGIDPVAQKRETRLADLAKNPLALTFDQCSAKYIEANKAGWSNDKHAAQWVATLATYASPFIGRYAVTAIETPHILQILEPIWTTKTETANRVRGRVESVLDWATARGYRAGDNPARWRGHLDKLLPKPSKVTEEKHFPALPFAQVGDFLPELKAAAGVAARAVEFAILTASRSGSVREAEWSEFDLDAMEWTIPASHMKAKREHRVPLSPAAVAMLVSIKPQTVDNAKPTGVVFKAPRGGVLSDMTLTAALRRLNDTRTDKGLDRWTDRDGRDIVVHGFRSTFRDWAGETTAYPREVIEHALAHQIKDKAEAAYARGSLFDKRRQLMNAWADYCALPSVKASANVVSLRA
jgi:integrase